MSGLLHPSEEDLVLLYYGESETAEAVQSHVQACSACRQHWDELRASLASLTDEALGLEETPGPSPDRIWERLAPQLPPYAPRRWRMPSLVLLAPLAAAAALVLAFQLGRRWPAVSPPPLPAPAPATAAQEARARERILLVAVGDHLERSQMLLVELVNTSGAVPADVEHERRWAEDLVGANRLYRQAAARAGEAGVASVLEELERLLVEVAHSPARLQPPEIARLQQRIESRGLLFKVRVLETRVRQREKGAAPLPRATS